MGLEQVKDENKSVNKLCVICNNKIINRKTKKAQTCNQHCAGKLAWKTILMN